MCSDESQLPAPALGGDVSKRGEENGAKTAPTQGRIRPTSGESGAEREVTLLRVPGRFQLGGGTEMSGVTVTSAFISTSAAGEPLGAGGCARRAPDTKGAPGIELLALGQP